MAIVSERLNTCHFEELQISRSISKTEPLSNKFHHGESDLIWQILSRSMVFTSKAAPSGDLPVSLTLITGPFHPEGSNTKKKSKTAIDTEVDQVSHLLLITSSDPTSDQHFNVVRGRNSNCEPCRKWIQDWCRLSRSTQRIY